MAASNVEIRLLGPAALLLALLLCVPATAAPAGAPVPGVAVEVRNHEGSFVGGNLIDNDPATAWVGGGTGVGPGKWIEFTFPGPVRLSGLKVANGHQGKGRFDAFRRLARGVILYPDGTRQKFTLKPEPGVQTLRLEPKVVDTFRVIITGVSPDAGDKAMGKAKVAVSEMTVLGEPADPAEYEQAMDTAAPAPEVGEQSLPADSAEPAAKAGPEKRPEPANKPEQKPAPKPAPKPEPKPVAEAEPVKKAEPAGKPEPAEQAEPVKKAEAPKKAEQPEPVKKPEPPKKSEPAKKPAPKPKAKKPARPKQPAKPAQAASKGATWLRPVAEVPADKPLAMGEISPWLDLELVAGIKRYFSHLTTLSDSYPEVFASPVRERERKAFLALQESVRRQKEFGHHHIAMLELIGLNFDKPVESGDGVSIHVHGPCRYYVGDKGYEFQADAVITMVRENGAWLISDVRDK